MDEIADDSAAKVKECQGAAPGLGQEQMPPRRRREAFSLPRLCTLPGSLADRAGATRQHIQPLLDQPLSDHTAHV